MLIVIGQEWVNILLLVCVVGVFGMIISWILIDEDPVVYLAKRVFARCPFCGNKVRKLDATQCPRCKAFIMSPRQRAHEALLKMQQEDQDEARGG